MTSKIYNENEYIAFNSYGGFSPSKDEYHILNTKTPLPWCNVMANENFGTIISSYGTVYTYFKNSREFKLTEWCNDWVSFNSGEEFEGIFASHGYNLIYGFGYTTVLEEENDVKKQMDIFIPTDKNVKVQYITLENLNKEDEKKVTIKYKIKPVLGVAKDSTENYILSRVNEGILEFKNPYSMEFSSVTSYIKVVKENNEVEYEYDKEDYSVKIDVILKPKEKLSFAILLGAYEDPCELKLTLDNLRGKKDIEKELNATKSYWRKKVVRNLDTKNEYLDIMANGWLLYQTIVCRLFARSGFYQAGGAIGFRDQLQDTMALISSWPEKTRKQIILHASKQFEKGDVLHWWHEHNNAGIRTYFSDDYLWLPYVLEEYVTKTKDYSILDVKTKYLEDKPMENYRELYNVFNNIEKEDTVYEHAKKAIMYSLSRINEQNGLLDIGDGDWNDGFSNIRGQSVWLTFFMMNLLEKFKNVAKIKKDEEMIKTADRHIHLFKHSIIMYTWDSDHFVRAFFENGEVLGANSNKECKIDLISQAWAVIAMKDYPDVQDELKTALESAEKYLVDKEHMLVRLLYPSFDKPKNNPGYIKAYVPGTRENGGQYTHAATWLAKAYFDLKEKEKGVEILNMINPISHSDTKEKADIYKVEPFVIAADIYSNPEHQGRGGWTWYTGSAAWMYKIIEDYLGKNR